jgi:hypothetical protein
MNLNIKAMKRLIFFLSLGMFVLASCQDEDQSLNQEIQLTFDVVKTQNGQTTIDLPEHISVELTVESASGINNLKRISFNRNGGQYVSEPVMMKQGVYDVHDMVINDERVVAIPDHLRHFSVEQDAKKVSMGKVAFHAKGALPVKIDVYVEQEGIRKLTDARVTIYDNQRELYVYNRTGRNHHFVFKGDPNAMYTLKIEKEGFEVFAISFTYRQLISKRLSITLQKKSTEREVTFQPSATYFSMALGFTGTGTVTLDWGREDDFEVIDFDGTSLFFREQAYALSTPPAKITGDIHLLTTLWFEYSVTELDVEYATALSSLALTQADIITLDLRTNHQLSQLEFYNTNIGELILPQQHSIKRLWIVPITDYTIWPSANDLNYIIDNIHMNAVASNIDGGYISLGGSALSEQTAGKLNELQNAYGWSIIY